MLEEQKQEIENPVIGQNDQMGPVMAMLNQLQQQLASAQAEITALKNKEAVPQEPEPEVQPLLGEPAGTILKNGRGDVDENDDELVPTLFSNVETTSITEKYTRCSTCGSLEHNAKACKTQKCGQIYHGKKWENPRQIYDPRAKQACGDILQELEENGTIEQIPVEEDLLEWNVPINMVIDKYEERNGEKVPVYRLCFDSRNVNSRKVIEPFPVVNVEDVFRNLGGKNHQSIMDLPRAFFSIKRTQCLTHHSRKHHPLSQ